MTTYDGYHCTRCGHWVHVTKPEDLRPAAEDFVRRLKAAIEEQG